MNSECRAVWVAVLILFTLAAPMKVWAAAACNEACTDYADCTTDVACPVCIGTCVDCNSLGDETTCQDLGSGALASCVWIGTSCEHGADVPEIPPWVRLGLLIGFAGLAAYFAARNRRLVAS